MIEMMIVLLTMKFIFFLWLSSTYLLSTGQMITPYHTVQVDKESIRVTHGNGQVVIDWGLTLPEDAKGKKCSEGDLCLDFGVAKIVVTEEDHCSKISWVARNLTELKDCVRLQGHWYGGGEQIHQPWPIEKHPRPETAFITSDMLQNGSFWYGGVLEAYWISSQGAAIRVDGKTPLFVTVPDTDGDYVADQLCLGSRNQLPFSLPTNTNLKLKYYVCTGENVKEVHVNTYPKFFSTPKGMPDLRMFQDPIWSSWAKYHSNVSASKVWDFAMAVKANGFNNSQVEIDDDWETCRGDATFNPKTFPDPKQLVTNLHNEGFRVTLWIHPFINDFCQSYSYADKHGYFVKDSKNKTQNTHWWQGKSAGIIDFTNPEAVLWWTQRLIGIQQSIGIDSFKFDAGEASYLPKIFTLNADQQLWPNAFSKSFIETVSKFGGMIEARVGMGTQEHPVFIRMLDKSSIWGDLNGLRTLIPAALHFGLIGYPYVLPDMIGGNGYIVQPDPDLFVRWAQINTFMTTLQFSIPPWKYGQNVTDMCKTVTALHKQTVPLMTQIAKESMKTGAPMMRPTWWLCPEIEDCLTADQQFLLGDEFLSVPVVEKDATTLRVVVPPGKWQHVGTQDIYKGPNTITLSGITLDSIVYFTKINTIRDHPNHILYQS